MEQNIGVPGPSEIFICLVFIYLFILKIEEANLLMKKIQTLDD